jgi:putative ABC transport system substrate-binding protein
MHYIFGEYFMFCIRSLISLLLFSLFTNIAFCLEPVTIGILMPMEHRALHDIVEGFKESVTEHYPHPVEFMIQNAQGDIKLQRSIIELFLGQQVDMVVPIGTAATQMTLSIVKDKPIVSLAAHYTEAERQKRTPKNITGVLDEIGGKRKLDLLKATIPNLKKVTIIFHSANEKNYPELEEITQYGKQLGIEVQKIAIQNLTELSSASLAIEQNSQAILILKDHLLASGVQLLVPIALERKIPLVTSDEGSVQEGGAFALGVCESAIGQEGGTLAAKVLNGVPIKDLPMKSVQNLTIFYNAKALEKQKIDVNKLRKYAAENQYELMDSEESR